MHIIEAGAALRNVFQWNLTMMIKISFSRTTDRELFTVRVAI